MNGAAPEPRRRAARILTAVTVTVIAAAAIAALKSTSRATRPSPPATLTACARQAAVDTPASVDARRRCYVRVMLREVGRKREPTAALGRIASDVDRAGRYPSLNCHTLMHAVGRRYPTRHKVTLATLMGYLPRSNDAGCAAGFAHGIITAIAPAVLRAGPAVATQVCGQATTRFLRYSCTHGIGHAYMRFYAESLKPSLRLCRALGPNVAADCAQGAYHDYWLAIIGADDTKRPAHATSDVRALCGRQPRDFVLGCWYRAFIESRPSGYETRTAADVTHICRDTTGLQRRGCITAASVIGSSNPLKQMRVCQELPARDVVACVHGVKVQNLIGTPASNQLVLIERCSMLKGALAVGCFEWLGKVLEVITDGTFSRTGCPQTTQPQACLRGARSYEGPLITFS